MSRLLAMAICFYVAAPETTRSTCPKLNFSNLCVNGVDKIRTDDYFYHLVCPPEFFHDSRGICSEGGLRSAAIQSVDLAQKIITYFKKSFDGHGVSDYMYWIGAPKDQPTYSFLGGTSSKDGLMTMGWDNSTNYPCQYLSWRDGTSDLFIKRDKPCETYMCSICESRDTMTPRRCNRYLTGKDDCFAAKPVPTKNESDCTDQCMDTMWCTGVNFNTVTMQCQLLNQYSAVARLQCAPNWVYFERSPCSV